MSARCSWDDCLSLFTMFIVSCRINYSTVGIVAEFLTDGLLTNGWTPESDLRVVDRTGL